MKKYLVLLIGMILAGCASSPVLYPNAHLKQVGQEQAQRDIDDCRRQADAYVKSAAAKTMAKDTALGGAGGAVVGGAAAGLVTGAIKASRPSPIYKTFVNRCLTNKGYDPIGWQD